MAPPPAGSRRRGYMRALHAAVALSAITGACDAPPAEQATPPRRTKPTGVPVVARLALPGQHCSAVRIGTTVALTSRHCLADERECELARIHFGMSAGQEPVADRCVALIQSNAGLDFTLFRLAGSYRQYPRLADVPAMPGDELELFGHPNGLLAESAQCQHRGEERLGLGRILASPHDCISAPGSSGSPLFLPNRIRVAGVHSAGGQFVPAHWIEAALEARFDPGDSPVVAAALAGVRGLLDGAGQRPPEVTDVDVETVLRWGDESLRRRLFDAIPPFGDDNIARRIALGRGSAWGYSPDELTVVAERHLPRSGPAALRAVAGEFASVAELLNAAAGARDSELEALRPALARLASEQPRWSADTLRRFCSDAGCQWQALAVLDSLYLRRHEPPAQLAAALAEVAGSPSTLTDQRTRAAFLRAVKAHPSRSVVRALAANPALNQLSPARAVDVADVGLFAPAAVRRALWEAALASVPAGETEAYLLFLLEHAEAL